MEITDIILQNITKNTTAIIYIDRELSALFDIWNYMLEEKKKELMESMEETKNAQE